MSVALDIRTTIKARVDNGLITDGVGFELYVDIAENLEWDYGFDELADLWNWD